MATSTMAQNPDKEKALNLVLNQIERSFGKGSIMRLGDAAKMKVETISSGALTLDLALGGGLPKGRIIEIYILKAQVKQPLPFMRSQKFKKLVASPPL